MTAITIEPCIDPELGVLPGFMWTVEANGQRRSGVAPTVRAASSRAGRALELIQQEHER